uniref:Uncharacterized protein n=1 Tax=Candidatus Kentrum sp. TC TaxID=2126339 RepID=A0A450ZV96_9GAMM|nr:MAG: hypothetical protein BECKTC1821F_GA0114240_101921 [Candidatus Kentron sp. TC]
MVSTALMGPMTQSFVRDIHDFAKQESVDIVPFAKGQGKDEVTQEYLARFPEQEGVLSIGKAQEKFNTFRVHEKFNVDTGQSFPDSNETKIEALAHEWPGKLPDPFTRKDHEAAFNDKMSILTSGVFPHPGFRPTIIRATFIRRSHHLA